MSSGIHQSVHALAVERSLNLLCICLRYCCNGICEHETALKKVGILVCLKLVRSKEVIRQTCYLLNILNIPLALEFDIMNSHYRLDSSVEITTGKSFMKIYRNKSCLPVMTMYKIRTEIQKWK